MITSLNRNGYPCKIQIKGRLVAVLTRTECSHRKVAAGIPNVTVVLSGPCYHAGGIRSGRSAGCALLFVLCEALRRYGSNISRKTGAIAVA
jgi:hypothetical protein